MKLNKSWKRELVFEVITIFIFSLPIFFGVFYITSRFLFGLIVYIAFMFLLYLRTLYSRFIQRKPLASVCYKLPLLENTAVVIEKHIRSYPAELFFREWLVFQINDGQHITVYIPGTGVGSKRNMISRIQVGDTGLLHYRKGEKYNYIEEFEISSPTQDNEMNELD